MIIYKLEVPGNNKRNLHVIEKSDDIQVEYVPLNIEEKESSGDNLNRTWHFQQYGFHLSEPEYLSCLTHRKAWELFLATKEDWCCIIEENIIININSIEIENALKQLEPNWDVFFPFSKSRKTNNEMAKISRNLLNPNIREMTEMESYYLGLLWGSHIYFVSRKGAMILYSANEIKQRVEDEIFFLTEHYNLETYYDEFSWFDPYRQIDFIPKERLENILNAVLTYNVWKPEALTLVREILSDLSAIATKLDIDLILQGGSHLGYIRHGCIMSWDDDVDLGIEETNLQQFLKEVEICSYLRFGVFLETRTSAYYYKIWHIDGAKIDGYEYTFPFIDIWLYDRNGIDLVFKNGIICPNSAIAPFINIDFEGADFKIPHNSLECLDTRYIDWRTNIRVYLWSHQLEKGELQPLTAPITVDSNGRIIKIEK